MKSGIYFAFLYAINRFEYEKKPYCAPRGAPERRRSLGATRCCVGGSVHQCRGAARAAGHLLFLCLGGGCAHGRPHAGALPLARRGVALPLRGGCRGRVGQFRVVGLRRVRLGYDRRTLVLGDARIRLSDLYQRRLSLSQYAPRNPARQSCGLLRAAVRGAPCVGGPAHRAPLRRRLLGVLRLSERSCGRLLRGQCPAFGVRHHGPGARGRQSPGGEGPQVVRRQLS